MPGPDPEGIVTRPSPFGFAETIDRIDSVLRARGLTVFARFDHAAAAREAGLEMPDATVLVFGNPRAGTDLMLASPLIALELPLRILVRADSGGAVFVSHADAAFTAARFGIPETHVAVLAAAGRVVEAALGD